MDASDTKKHIRYLERVRIHYVPLKYIKKFVKNTSDIYRERKLLKSVSFDNKSIQYIVDIIVNDLVANSRFRRVECLKVLKRIIKNRSSSNPYNKELLKKLFYLYQTFIINSSEEIQWAVSTFIKDQPLEKECINWLIDNYEESVHIVNRLLRYPIQNQLITNWAHHVLTEGKLKDRISEVIGILIDDDIPESIKVDNTILMWAIYYSKSSEIKKRTLILKHLDYQDYSSALDVAGRLRFGEISKELLKYYRGLFERIDNVE